jgi:Skp family chaperone for outer membrane proteins
MKARADARQDKADAKIEARFNQFNKEIKAHQAKTDAHVERMEAIMRSIPSDIDESSSRKLKPGRKDFCPAKKGQQPAEYRQWPVQTIQKAI